MVVMEQMVQQVEEGAGGNGMSSNSNYFHSKYWNITITAIGGTGGLRYRI